LRSGPLKRGLDRILGLVADRNRKLSAIHAASDRRRWRLLAHAVEKGPFLATQAASIAKLSPKSGNARTTHAEGLRRTGLLKRERGRPVRYRASAPGIDLYRQLKQVFEASEPERPEQVQLGTGDHVDIVGLDGPASRQHATVFRISRKA
jgi:hypothetical protein